ncbi:MAG TPA: nucleoside-diphosphate kinase [Candidatus Nanoarchaeia archaeon]|nr:nucleoside-diphosphate kinase [Candidatus Nanoarchaeia archaeon]
MIERTLVLFKPDTVLRGIVGELLARFERTGFKIVGMKLVHASNDLVGKHYEDNAEWMKSLGEKTKKSYEAKGVKVTEDVLTIGKRVRAQLMEFMTLAPSMAIVLEGHDVISKVRLMVGGTAPNTAAPGTIRGDYAFDSYGLADTSGRPLQNIIHASDSKESAVREIAVWFEPNELFSYARVEDALLYRKVNLKVNKNG